MAGIFDRRRIQAPESSYTPTFSQEQQSSSSRSSSTRPIFLKTGLISQANGSGYIEAGKVKIACSVYGPRPKQPPYSPQGSLNLEIKFAPFASHPRRAPLRDTEPAPLSELLSSHLLPALQLHLLPKSTLDVHLLILETDILPNVLSAGLTVASAAIADAGIPMFGLGVGATVSKLGSDNLVNPEEEGEAISTVGIMPALNKLTGLWLVGEVDVDEVCKLVETAAASTKSTHGLLARALISGAEERQSATISG